MGKFIMAYIAMYGGTKDHARKVWYNTDKVYHDLIIESSNNDARKSFYND